ncbi:MAG TPA: ABC transporter ATP-binding protein, partial [Candidatus Dormibacteraeota bacterium]|nr:ABC transporter ATP-binding protein [Candidatus Dormibacteraeota bacterium]
APGASPPPGPPAAPRAMADLVIETENLVKRYGRTTALDGLSMRVPSGEVFGFLGPNGAGKTTAVKLLVGLTAPTAGNGRVLGRPLGDVAARRAIGYLPELFRYQPWMSGRELLAFHSRLAGLPRAGQAAAIADALEIVGLRDRAQDRVGGYSKGMQQRLGLAAALLGRPELVFLDEPTSALDPVGRMEMRPIIRGLKERGTTVFLNSHLLTEVEQVCDRVAIIDRGKVVALGTLEELLAEDEVRFRVGGLDEAGRARLARYGSVRDDGEWLAVRGLAADRVPEVVAGLVAGGARVYAVEPRRESLEERFSRLVSGGDG